jgi:hypothetical protein
MNQQPARTAQQCAYVGVLLCSHYTVAGPMADPRVARPAESGELWYYRSGRLLCAAAAVHDARHVRHECRLRYGLLDGAVTTPGVTAPGARLL